MALFRLNQVLVTPARLTLYEPSNKHDVKGTIWGFFGLPTSAVKIQCVGGMVLAQPDPNLSMRVSVESQLGSMVCKPSISVFY